MLEESLLLHLNFGPVALAGSAAGAAGTPALELLLCIAANCWTTSCN